MHPREFWVEDVGKRIAVADFGRETKCRVVIGGREHTTRERTGSERDIRRQTARTTNDIYVAAAVEEAGRISGQRIHIRLGIAVVVIGSCVRIREGSAEDPLPVDHDVAANLYGIAFHVGADIFLVLAVSAVDASPGAGRLEVPAQITETLREVIVLVAPLEEIEGVEILNGGERSVLLNQKIAVFIHRPAVGNGTGLRSKRNAFCRDRILHYRRSLFGAAESICKRTARNDLQSFGLIIRNRDSTRLGGIDDDRGVRAGKLRRLKRASARKDHFGVDKIKFAGGFDITLLNVDGGIRRAQRRA